MSLTPQAHFYRPSAAASVPFRRLSAHSPGWRFPTLRIGRPNLDLRSRFGQPMHNPKSLSVLFPPQRLLHSTTASALANPKRSADHNTPHRTALARSPQTSRSRTSQSLSSFLSRAPSRLTLYRAARASLTPLASRRNAVSGFCRANKRSAARSSLQGVFRTAKG